MFTVNRVPLFECLGLVDPYLPENLPFSYCALALEFSIDDWKDDLRLYVLKGVIMKGYATEPRLRLKRFPPPPWDF